MKAVLQVCSLASVHFVTSFFVSFMERISGGAWRIASDILLFPISIAPKLVLDISWWLMPSLLIAISFTCGLAITFALHARRK